MEIWKPIKGWEGYEVSSLGRVKLRRGRITSGSISKRNPYPRVGLSRDGKTTLVAVHRLVAEAFLPRIIGCDIVNHLNEIKTDNRVENLEWTDVAGNNKHSSRIPVFMYSTIREEYLSGATSRSLAEKYSVTHPTILKIVNHSGKVTSRSLGQRRRQNV